MKSRLVCLIALVFLFSLASLPITAQGEYRIKAGSAGPIKIGMTVEQAQAALPNHSFKRTFDGEGIALIAVKEGKKLVFTLYAGEEDPDQPVNETRVIEQIEIWDSRYKTTEGVGEGAPISEAVKKYGEVTEIMMSEIEAREFVQFKNGPQGIIFRAQGAGVYKDGANKTLVFRMKSRISSIIIQGDGSEPNVGFFSDYTELSRGCKTPKTSEGGHSSTFCDGPQGFRVHMFDSAKNMNIVIESTESRANVSFPPQSLDFPAKGQVIEWRFKNGVPFAAILRGNTYKKGDDGTIKYPVEKTGEFLYVRGLPGFEAISGKINPRTTKFANREARKLADEGYIKVKFPKNDYQMIDTSDLNLKIITAANNGEEWVKSAAMVGARLAGEFEEARSRKMYWEASSGEGFDQFKLTIETDGFLDDSVRGEKVIMEFKRESDGVWKVVSAKKAWRCWAGRGHEDYSAVPCI